MAQPDFTADAALSSLRAAARAVPPPPLEQAAFDAARQAVEGVRDGDGALAAVAIARSRAEKLWKSIRATPAYALGGPPAACRKGCGWCCHQRVGAALIEVLALARDLAGRPEAALIADWRPGRPCAFLKDGACAIYDVRPLKCRSLWHVDVRHCMARYAAMPVAAAAGVSADARPEPRMIFEGALKGLVLPLIKAGHDCPGVELMPALQAVAGQPDAAARWWSGQPVVPPELRLDWFPVPPAPQRRRR
ncbi:YkgJ family cysteine cluster protein [Magnetospirillum sp. UT-4]|uniref:YkgJ family cysteine cluster protein n=1 Tax=Magnetospirillum sp. UT-4 TaxID=2681467 RepID=UPI001572D6C2|nr:YkgJ family cysteine cluster protein [Magnetospirillum sp. UT-4]